MSHIVAIRTQVRDPVAIAAACKRLNLPEPTEGKAELFSGQSVSGHQVRLSGWRYPVVCNVATGELHYDNFEGHWGDYQKLQQFLQTYAVEKARLEAHRQGHAVTEQALADGSIKLTIHVGGTS